MSKNCISLEAVGRLAPSPTGRLHLGNAFSFLMAWCAAAAEHGRLVLRIEDIDPDRSRPEFTLGILEDLNWLGLSWDEGPQTETGEAAMLRADSATAGARLAGSGKALCKEVSNAGQGNSEEDPLTLHETGSHGPYLQSRRLAVYEAVLGSLQARGLIYPCFCTRKELRMLASAPHIGDEGAPYPGTCRSLSQSERIGRIARGKRFSLRLDTRTAMRALTKGAAESESSLLSFQDAVLGPQSFGMEDCGGDFALRRSDGVFAYQLAVTVDDSAMGVTRVVRGEDLLLSTPRQILLLRLLKAPVPCYAHVPLLYHAADERLAKRHKSLELRAIRASGVSPETVIGYLGHLAGLLDTPRPMPARELLPFFSFDKLTGKRLIVDGNAFGSS